MNFIKITKNFHSKISAIYKIETNFHQIIFVSQYLVKSLPDSFAIRRLRLKQFIIVTRSLTANKRELHFKLIWKIITSRIRRVFYFPVVDLDQYFVCSLSTMP